MAKSARQAPVKEDNDDLYDLGNVPKTEGGNAMIQTAGITHDLQVKFALEDGDYKDKTKGKWQAFAVTITDPNGLELKELFFRPASKEDEVKFFPKFYEPVEGKMVSTREATAREAIKIYNNEFMAYLIDLGEALGYSNAAVKEHLFKLAKGGAGFESLAKGFIEKFRPTDTTRISAKIKWFNNNKSETSNIGIHGPFNVYYPFGNDLFDIYKKDRPSSLAMSKYEKENNLVKKYSSSKASSDAPPADGGAVQGKAEWNTSKGNTGDIDDEDPF